MPTTALSIKTIAQRLGVSTSSVSLWFRDIERFWLDLLGLPEANLLKSVVNVYSRHSKRKRLNMLPYGTARVVVNRTSVLQSIYGAIQEYAGISREAWLG